MEPQKSVILDDTKLPIASPLTWRRITPFPAQFSTSQPGVEDYTPTRKQKFAKVKGGMGKEKWDPNSEDRFWDADGVDASRDVQTLGPLVTTMGTGAGVFGVQPVKIIKFRDKIWAIGHEQISYWTGAAWQSANPTTPIANPTDAIVFFGAV